MSVVKLKVWNPETGRWEWVVKDENTGKYGSITSNNQFKVLGEKNQTNSNLKIYILLGLTLFLLLK